MPVRSGIAMVILALGSVPGMLRAQEPLTDVRLVATDTLRDVALTLREHGRPVIYYNPALIERVGPLLRDFFIAHEYGHVFHDHVGGALATPDSSVAEIRQRQELDALRHALSRLRPAERALLALAQEGRSQVEMAEITGTSVVVVKARQTFPNETKIHLVWGAVAFVPFLLLWMLTAWVIVLVGAALLIRRRTRA